MIYKYKPIDAVISKIVTNLGLGEEEIPYQNFVEWIISGLKHIGVHYQFEEKQEMLEVENFQAALPCDFYKLIRLYKEGNVILHNNSRLIGEKESDIENNKNTDVDYRLQNNRILFSFKTGKVKIQYTAIPVDDRGLPLCPDSESYDEALFWKVVYQMNIYGHEFKNKNFQNIMFVRDQWWTYCRQARASGNMPDLERLEDLKNNWLRLYHYNDSYQQGFSKSGKDEDINYGR